MSDTDQVNEAENAPKRGKWPPWIRAVLAAIIIVYLLASILLPALNRERDSANRERCLWHLKIIGWALKQYAVDNEEVFPWADIEPDQSYRCFGKLYPQYWSSTEVLTCPSSKDTPFKFDEDREDGQLLGVEQCRESLSYAYGHHRNRPWTETALPCTRLAADKYANVDYTDDPFPSNTPANHLNMITDGRPAGRNVVCIDGREEWDNNKGPLDADPDVEVDGSGDARNDQTGPDWWSDPPEK